MKSLIVIFGLSVYAICYADNNLYSGNPRDCRGPENKDLLTFEVLPGLGWDNLANEEKGLVVNLNYSQCKTTEDGNYLIPDSMFVLPIKSSRTSIFSKICDHWSNYETDTSGSINARGSFKGYGFKISGSMSAEFQSVKRGQIENNALTTKVQANYHRYTAKLQPDAELCPVFRARILRIADHIQHSRNMSARYESELLVRDFGTHVLETVNAGASVVKVDHVQSTITEESTYTKRSIALAASFSHHGFFNSEQGSVSADYGVSKDFFNKYMTSIASSEIRTHGGPTINPENFTLREFTDQIGNNLVAIDRDGFTLEYIITPQTFPELPEGLIQDVTRTIQAAIYTYLRHNTYPGCTDQEAPNFSVVANADDGSCRFPFSNIKFGGLYQKCSEEPSTWQCNVKNPHTNDYSCPDGFKSTLLQNGQYPITKTESKCHRCWLFFKCCSSKYINYVVQYTTYWCYSESVSQEAPGDNGFLFGGLYTNKINNVITLSQSCPPHFTTVDFANNIFMTHKNNNLFMHKRRLCKCW